MEAATSAILAEIFIQYLEHTNIINILKKHQITDYYRYVDDLLTIYNEDTTNIENTLADFNSIHPNIQFTIKKETHNKINYLDLSITNTYNTLTFNI
jgi:nucleoside-specific outer membrane channel protein Tsx